MRLQGRDQHCISRVDRDSGLNEEHKEHLPPSWIISFVRSRGPDLQIGDVKNPQGPNGANCLA